MSLKQGNTFVGRTTPLFQKFRFYLVLAITVTSSVGVILRFILLKLLFRQVDI